MVREMEGGTEKNDDDGRLCSGNTTSPFWNLYSLKVVQLFGPTFQRERGIKAKKALTSYLIGIKPQHLFKS